MDGAPNRLENLRTLRNANLDAAFATAFMTLTTGGFLVGFVKSLKGEKADLWLGLLTALPSLVGLSQIPGATWGRSFASYKQFVWPGGLIWRLMHIPLVLLPFLGASVFGFSADVMLIIILSCAAIGAVCVNVVNPIYNDWLAELVPSNSRGAFFSTRNSLNVAVGAGVGIVGGLLLDRFKLWQKPELGFTTIFALGFACALLSFHYFWQMKDLTRPEPVTQDLKETVRSFGMAFRDPNFRKVLLFLSVFISGQVLPGNLWAAYALESLKMDFTQLTMLSVFHACGNVIMSRHWGFLADKYGNKPILTICAIGIFLSPLAWFATQPGNPVLNLSILFVSHVFMGIIWSGVALCQFNIIFATSPNAQRSIYLGTAMATQAVVGCVAPLLGAFMLSQLRHVFPTTANPALDAAHAYKIVFIFTMVIRFSAIFLLIPIREEGSKAFKDTIKHLKKVTPGGLRAMRDFNRSGEATEREAALKTMANQSLSLAVDEFVTALHDPSPRVRRQAAVALGRLGDRSSVGELIHQLQEHPDLVEEETIEALGVLGDERALPELVKLLSSPRPILRRAAARSISEIPGATTDRGALDALLTAAEDQNDPDLRRAALQALRNLGATGVGATLSHALLDKHPSVRIAAAEAAAELQIPETAQACRASLKLYEDEACAEVAYALGVVGEISDAELILTVAQKCVSMITRRRCLLGVARLYQVEQSAYRMMMLSGMARDKEMISLLTIHGKRSKSANLALEAIAQGDEPGAVRSLNLGSEAAALSQIPVDEAFVVAACLYNNRLNKRISR